LADVLLLLTALLASFGFDTQSLSAQGGQRRPPLFQQRSGQPPRTGRAMAQVHPASEAEGKNAQAADDALYEAQLRHVLASD